MGLCDVLAFNMITQDFFNTSNFNQEVEYCKDILIYEMKDHSLHY